MGLTEAHPEQSTTNIKQNLGNQDFKIEAAQFMVSLRFFGGVLSVALTMFSLNALFLAKLIAASFPLPLPIATAERMLLKSPLIGGMNFCGLLISVFESVFIERSLIKLS